MKVMASASTANTPLLMSPALGAEAEEERPAPPPAFQLVPPVDVDLGQQGRTQTISGIAGIPSPMKTKFRNTAKSAANEAVHSQTLHNMMIFSGTANPALAQEIAEHLDT